MKRYIGYAMLWAPVVAVFGLELYMLADLMGILIALAFIGGAVLVFAWLGVGIYLAGLWK